MRQPLDPRLDLPALGDVLAHAEDVFRGPGRVADGDLLQMQQPLLRPGAEIGQHVIFADAARFDEAAILGAQGFCHRALEIVGGGLADKVLPPDPEDGLPGPVEHDIATVRDVLHPDHGRDMLDHRLGEDTVVFRLLPGGFQVLGQLEHVGGETAPLLAGRAQEVEKRAHPGIAAVRIDHDEPPEEIARPAAHHLCGEVGGQRLRLHDQGLGVHQQGDGAVREQGAAIGAGHAQQEGVALHQADRALVGVHHRDQHHVRLRLEAPVDRVARHIGSDRRDKTGQISDLHRLTAASMNRLGDRD